MYDERKVPYSRLEGHLHEVGLTTLTRHDVVARHNSAADSLGRKSLGYTSKGCILAPVISAEALAILTIDKIKVGAA